jgi:hypothetical protein
MTQYTFHEDPGHGWLEVTRTELVRLGIASRISAYSYQKGDSVFLEEDCDANTFAHAKKAAGEAVSEVTTVYNDDAPCRGYDRYRP